MGSLSRGPPPLLIESGEIGRPVMASPKMRVTYLDGREEIVLAGPKAQVALERKYGKVMSELNGNEHVYYLAWSALWHAGREPADFDDWLDRIEDADAIGDADTNPTQADPPNETSSG